MTGIISILVVPCVSVGIIRAAIKSNGTGAAQSGPSAQMEAGQILQNNGFTVDIPGSNTQATPPTVAGFAMSNSPAGSSSAEAVIVFKDSADADNAAAGMAHTADSYGGTVSPNGLVVTVDGSSDSVAQILFSPW